MTKRSDTLAAQVAALDMVMRGIEEGRDMRAFVGGMMRGVKDMRDAALEAEAITLPCDDCQDSDFEPQPAVRGSAYCEDHQAARDVLVLMEAYEDAPDNHAISVRAAYAFGDWPPTGKGE